MYKILGISSPIPHRCSVVLIAYSTIDTKQRLQLKNFYLIFFLFVSRMQLQNVFKNSCSCSQPSCQMAYLEISFHGI